MLFSFIFNLIFFILWKSKESVLVQRCLDGDEKAERILAERYLSRITVFVSYKLKVGTAEALGITVELVKSRLYEARKRLRQELSCLRD